MKIDQHQIREYLLNPQSSASEEFEELLFSDDSLHLAVLEEQESLIEDFVRGQLRKADAQCFQRQCDLYPELNERVNELRLLIGALERSRAYEDADAAAHRRYGWQFYGLAASIVCVACLLLVWLTFVHPRRAPDAAAARPFLSSTQVTQSIEPPIGPGQKLFLADGITRGPSSLPQLKIMPDTSTLQLQLELRGSSASIPSWSITLLRGTEPVWHEEDIQTQRVGGEVFLAAHIPAASMPDGIYTVKMTPLESERRAQKRDFVVERSK